MMAQIISFIPKKKMSNESRRWKALAKGTIMTFTCNTCGEEFEVVDDEYPDLCPGCGRRITQFKKLEENI